MVPHDAEDSLRTDENGRSEQGPEKKLKSDAGRFSFMHDERFVLFE